MVGPLAVLMGSLFDWVVSFSVLPLVLSHSFVSSFWQALGQKWGNLYANQCHLMPSNPRSSCFEKALQPLLPGAVGLFCVNTRAQSACEKTDRRYFYSLIYIDGFVEWLMQRGARARLLADGRKVTTGAGGLAGARDKPGRRKKCIEYAKRHLSSR